LKWRLALAISEDSQQKIQKNNLNEKHGLNWVVKEHFRKINHEASTILGILLSGNLNPNGIINGIFIKKKQNYRGNVD
jgi:hypothetical protein